jgi:hypothetical protein
MNAAVLTPREMEARCLDQYAAMTGTKRDDTIEYMRGVISGAMGTTSQAGRDYARRILDAMRA